LDDLVLSQEHKQQIQQSTRQNNSWEIGIRYFSVVSCAHNFPVQTDISAIGEHLSMFFTSFVLCMHRNCYFRAFGQNSDFAITFSGPNSIKGSNNLAIRRCFQVLLAFFTVQIENQPHFYIWSTLSNDLEHVLNVALRTGIISPSSKSVNTTYPFLTYNIFAADTLRHSVTLTFDRLTLNVCSQSTVS